MISFWIGLAIGVIIGSFLGTMIACLMLGCIRDED